MFLKHYVGAKRSKGLNISKENYKELKEAILEQTGQYQHMMERLKEDWK